MSALCAQGGKLATDMSPPQREIESLRVIVAIADPAIDRRVICRNEPLAAAHTGSDVCEREPLELCCGKSRVDRKAIVPALAVRPTRRRTDGNIRLAELNVLYVEE